MKEKVNHPVWDKVSKSGVTINGCKDGSPCPNLHNEDHQFNVAAMVLDECFTQAEIMEHAFEMLMIKIGVESEGVKLRNEHPQDWLSYCNRLNSKFDSKAWKAKASSKKFNN